jgi:hypothetical protein
MNVVLLWALLYIVAILFCILFGGVVYYVAAVAVLETVWVKDRKPHHQAFPMR